ncbi:MAG: D-alanyl-D-alanine carboxypeptidase/D-alanyl-D-alanine-endopeptidase [Planctomycetota bacterium]
MRLRAVSSWLLASLVGVAAHASAQGDLSAKGIARAVAAAEALGARTGVAVCDAGGRWLFRHAAGDAFAPASNMKVLTAAAVVNGLGADFHFTTTFALRGGRLVVVASGDPNWIQDSLHDSAHVFAAVARALAQKGVTAVAGIDLDAGNFTGPARPPTWPQDQLQTYYCAPTGPFVLEQGTFALRVEPRGANAAASVIAPFVDVPVRGAIELVDRSKGAVYGAVDQGDGVKVSGRFPRRGSAATIRTAVADPAWWYEQALRKALADAGVRIGATAAVADQVVHEHRSDLRLAVLRMLEDSSNFDAEQCLRVLGSKVRGDGSLAGGVAALHDEVARLVGRVPEGSVLVDGSGLSKQNRVSAGLLAAVLVRNHAASAGPLLRACLPVAGQTGTLQERFRGTDLIGRVRAKTGWIRGASALSGMVERRDGSVRFFAILMNYDPKKDGINRDLKQLQEEIVAAIDRADGGA